MPKNDNIFPFLSRRIIQVLVSGSDQTMAVNVYSDSTGEALYQEVQRRCGISSSLQILLHGASVVRHSLSVGKQGMHHHSTIFVFIIGKGGGKVRLGKRNREGGWRDWRIGGREGRREGWLDII